MGMSKQTTFTLTFLVGLSVLVPGSAGYLSAKMDAVQRAYRDLVSLESRFREEQLLAPVQEEPQIQTIAVPAMPCEIPPLSQPKRKRAPAPPALIPVPVEALPAETLPGAPGPTEGLRIEPLPDEPGPDEPDEGTVGDRRPFTEHGDEAGRRGRTRGRTSGRTRVRARGRAAGTPGPDRHLRAEHGRGGGSAPVGAAPEDPLGDRPPRVRSDRGLPRVRSDRGLPRVRSDRGLPRVRSGRGAGELTVQVTPDQALGLGHDLRGPVGIAPEGELEHRVPGLDRHQDGQVELLAVGQAVLTRGAARAACPAITALLSATRRRAG